MTVFVRTARVSDAPEIANLTAQLGYDVESSAFTGRLTSILARSDQRFLVADLEGHAVGWLHALIFEEIEADPFVVIGGLVVDNRHRRQRIGRMLMSEAEKWAQEQRCSVVRLWSSAGRTAAHRFYEQLGYTNIKMQYSFAKSLRRGQGGFDAFIPRIDRETS
jgi:GNAT superfamily N-acetyltransferase